MRVKLIAHTPNIIDVLYTSARTCYNAGSPINMFEKTGNIDKEKKLALIHKVLQSGHTSVLEHVSFTFAVEDTDRTVLAQISRHRTGISLSVQSQRYVDFSNGGFNYTTPPDVANSEHCKEYNLIMEQLQNFYDREVHSGIKPEHARMVLPNACCTNMIITMNLRELVHICGLRLCTRAQLEIRQLMQAIRNEVLNSDDIGNWWLDEYLQPKCHLLGVCTEDKCCGLKPKLEEVLYDYEKHSKSKK